MLSREQLYLDGLFTNLFPSLLPLLLPSGLYLGVLHPAGSQKQRLPLLLPLRLLPPLLLRCGQKLRCLLPLLLPLRCIVKSKGCLSCLCKATSKGCKATLCFWRMLAKAKGAKVASFASLAFALRVFILI
jgi:hypothetical protein